jgi:hypothetical protein
MRRSRLAIAATTSIVLAGCADNSFRPSESTRAVSVTTGVTRILVAGTPPAVGASSQFTAVAVLTDGSSETVTAQATWRSSNAAVATVSAGGMVSARSAGPVVISATHGGAEGSLSFTVAQAAAVTLSGTVTDAATRTGLPATVTVKDAAGTKSAAADTTGRYAIHGLAAGPADVTVTASGYVAVTKSIQLIGDTTLDFALARLSPCPLIGFDGAGAQGDRFTSYTSCGFTVTATTSNWTVSTGYGHPAPFIQFVSPAGSTTAGEVIVTAAGGAFTFRSVDIYSSTTKTPYVITGIANSAVVFTVQGTQGNTFGDFATVVNPYASARIDTLVIRLSNPSAACCANPMGLDNILFGN